MNNFQKTLRDPGRQKNKKQNRCLGTEQNKWRERHQGGRVRGPGSHIPS